MSEPSEQSSCRIELIEPADDEERDRQTRRVRRELSDAGIPSSLVDSTTPPPEGARGLGADEIGQLLATIPPSLIALRGLISCLRSWVSSGSRRRVVLEMDGDRLEVTNATAPEQDKLIDAWIGRHKVA